MEQQSQVQGSDIRCGRLCAAGRGAGPITGRGRLRRTGDRELEGIAPLVARLLDDDQLQGNVPLQGAGVPRRQEDRDDRLGPGQNR